MFVTPVAIGAQRHPFAAGQFGNTRITMKNLEVVEVDTERNLLLSKGSVPGARNSLLRIRKAKTGIPRTSKASKEDK